MKPRKSSKEKANLKKLAALSKKEEKLEAEMNKAVHRKPKKSGKKGK